MKGVVSQQRWKVFCNPSTPDDSFEANVIEVETRQGSTNYIYTLIYFLMNPGEHFDFFN